MKAGGGSRRSGANGRKANVSRGGKRPASGGRHAKGTAKATAQGSGTRPKATKPPAASATKAQSPPDPRTAAASTTTPPQPRGPFRLGAIPGATPGTWIDRWHDRMPQVELRLIPLATADQRRALVEASVDAALVRLPLERDGLHVIPLYDEVPVVVCAADSHLTAADELTLADLAGELVITPGDDVLGSAVPGATPPTFDAPETTEDAVATVAAGVGIVILPMSLARLHHRRDVASRPLTDGPASTVALAWPADATTPLVEAFVGIVRGRTANSSRGS